MSIGKFIVFGKYLKVSNKFLQLSFVLISPKQLCKGKASLAKNRTKSRIIDNTAFRFSYKFY